MLTEEASKAYYEGKPIMSDEEFDAIDDTEEVGYEVHGNKTRHMYPMWSLQKAYGDEKPLKDYTGEIISSPKLDGAAIALEYVGGKLVKAITRGNGKEGVDITDKILTLNLPEVYSYSGNIQITGEIVAPTHIKNARNYAAGAINLKSVEEFRTREVRFIAYSIQPAGPSYLQDMLYLQGCGFDTVVDQDWADYPQDGVVFRINDRIDFEERGYTSKFPKGAYAHKTQAAGVVTKLLDVEWNVGRSGVVSPVAILEPVMVGDATVSRATLHNMAYIEALGLEIGCNVEVIRSGEIIPRIIKRVETS